jgi:predicted TPR repeat methyltransferase
VNGAESLQKINDKTMNENNDALFTEAYQLQREGKLPQAISLYEKLLQFTPAHGQALHFLGLAYAQLGDMNSAIDFLQQALSLQPNDPSLHNNLANAYKHSQQLNEAIFHYQQAIQLSPDYAQAQHNLATVYALQNEYQKALHHYRLAVHAEPDFTAAHFNLGLLLLKNNELAAAKTQFKNVLTLQPNHLEAQFYLGILYLEANSLVKAKQAFEKVIEQDKHHIQALTNLGVIALKHEQGQLAVSYFTNTLAIDNEHVAARNNLAATFMHHDRFENALMHYDVLLKQEPHNIEYLYNSGVAQMALGHLSEAINHFEEILRLQNNHFAALNNLAAIYIRLEDKEHAHTLLERAVAANSADKASQHMLHALTVNNTKLGKKLINPPTCPEYAANLFNNYALYYDQHLQDQLNYSLPQQITRLLHHLSLDKVNEAIDLGCGTGLTGAVLRKISQHLTGVDIAAKMLTQARKKGIYDKLVEAELETFLKKNKQHYDLAVAADVLPYLGQLDCFFTALAKQLNPDSYFIFTIEISEDKPWQLQTSARFSHHIDYIKQLCYQLNLQIIHQEKVIARQQHQEALFVTLFTVQKKLCKLL